MITLRTHDGSLLFHLSLIDSSYNPGRGFLKAMDIAKPAIPKISSPIQFVREVVTELKKVTWPTRAETVKLTLVVIVLSFVVGAFVGILDITFLKITTLLFQR